MKRSGRWQSILTCVVVAVATSVAPLQGWTQGGKCVSGGYCSICKRNVECNHFATAHQDATGGGKGGKGESATDQSVMQGFYQLGVAIRQSIERNARAREAERQRLLEVAREQARARVRRAAEEAERARQRDVEILNRLKNPGEGKLGLKGVESTTGITLKREVSTGLTLKTGDSVETLKAKSGEGVDGSAPEAQKPYADDSELRPCGTATFGDGMVPCSDFEPKRVVDARDVRRAVYIARAAAQFAYAEAAQIDAHSLEVANGVAPVVSIDDTKAPAVSEAGLRAFQEENARFRKDYVTFREAETRRNQTELKFTKTADAVVHARTALEKALADKSKNLAVKEEALAALLAAQKEHDRERTEAKLATVIARQETNVSAKRARESLAALAGRTAWEKSALVGGTTWTFGARLDCEETCRAEVKKHLKEQVELQCRAQGKPARCVADLPFNPDHYGLIVSVGSAHDPVQDIATRVLFDHVGLGEFSARNKEAFVNLLDKKFETLDCHSNGAMVCLAALRSGRTEAKHVRLLGPQMSEEAAKRWAELAKEKGIEITVYVANGDPVLGASWTLPQTKLKAAAAGVAASLAAPAVAGGIATIAAVVKLTGIEYEVIEGAKRIVGATLLPKKTEDAKDKLKSLGIRVVTLPCADATDVNIDCHSAKRYDEFATRYEAGRAREINDGRTERP